MAHFDRRDFLKVVPAAAGAVASVARGDAQSVSRRRPAVRPADVKIGSAAYTPVPDYPIQPKRYSEVTLTDAFWKPKVRPTPTSRFRSRCRSSRNGERGFSGNVLEAAILSLKTHPNAQLQAQVDARVQQLARGAVGRATAASRSRRPTTTRPASGICSTTRSSPPTRCTRTSSSRTRRSPAASATPSTACSCTGSRTTGSISIWRSTTSTSAGSQNSVNRSRHNQSYKPVLEQSEAVGHAVNCVTLMVSLADVGVLTGLKEYFDAAQRMWRRRGRAEDVRHRRRRHDRQRRLRRAVLAAEHLGLFRDVRGPDVHHAEPPAVHGDRRQQVHRRDGTRHVQQRDRRRVGVGQSLLLRQPAGERRRRPRYPLGARVARVLPAESRALPRVDAGLHLRAGQAGCDLRQPVRVERDVVQGRRRKNSACRWRARCRGAASRRITVSTAGGREGHHQAAHSGLGPESDRARHLYSYPTRSTKPVTVSVNGKSVSAVPDKSGYVSLDRIVEDRGRRP